MRPIWIGLFAGAALAVGSLVMTLEEVRGDAAKPPLKAIDIAGAETIVDVLTATEKIEASSGRGSGQGEEAATSTRSAEEATLAGVDWLASVQGNNGGWGQDGGETSFVRVGENLESNGNDLANTAVAVLALVEAGHTPDSGKHRAVVQRGLEFVLHQVEASPEEGLAVSSITGTQIQRKLGPYIPTFLTARLLAEIDGEMTDPKLNRRVHAALEKCVRKIEQNQESDGSWNVSGGWAPILGTSMASRSLAIAKDKKVDVSEMVLARVDNYTKLSAKAVAAPVAAARASGLAGGVSSRSVESALAADASSAGVALYKGAQVLEQLSRTEEDRERNADEIAAISGQLANGRFVRGFGSMGGEEFFSYLNISDSLRRTGGHEWEAWNGKIKTQLVRMQNDEGSWAGHHCITGRVAVTSAAVLTLLADQQPLDDAAVLPTSN